MSTKIITDLPTISESIADGDWFIVENISETSSSRTSKAAASTVAAYVGGNLSNITISQVSGLQTALDGKQPLDADLTALAGLSSTGILVRTASETYAQRTITGTAAELTVTNGDGVSGNPTLSLPSALTFTGKTVTGGTYAGIAGLTASGAVTPSSNDAAALGSTSLGWADLFLATGAVINWANSEVTLTETDANTLTLAGGTLVLPASGLQVGSSNPFSDSAGTLTLQNVDALDATTESTIEAAIDTLANLTSVQGHTLTLTGALIRSGAHSLTLTTTGTTDVTLPTTGTLATLAGSESLSGKTLVSPIITTSPTAAGATWTDLGAVTTADINGGTIDGTVIGGASAAAGTFTTLTGTTGVLTTLELGHASDTTISRVSSGVIAVEGATVWTSGNDGAGSGLDADLLDGKHTGTSGNVVPLLDGANTWSAQQTISLGSAATTEPLRLVNTTDAASVQAIQIEGDRATMAANDEVYASMLLSDSGGTQTEFARLTAVATDVTDTSEDGQFEIDVMIAGSLTQVAAFSGTGLNLAASDALSFGGVAILSDSAGTTTLSNIDALDATTETTIEAAIDTLANLTSVQGRTVTLADAGFDVLLGWDDSEGAYKNFALADMTTEGAPAAGDYVLIYGAEGDLRRVNWSSLPGAGGGMTNLADDTDPALGGNLDANTFSILFDDNTGILDQNGNEVLLFQTVASAVNYVDLFDAATGANPKFAANGSDADVGLDFEPKGAGKFNFLATTSGPAELRLFEDADNGSNYAGVIAPASLGSNITITLPSATGTLATLAGSETLTNKVIDAATITTSLVPTTNDGAALGSTSNGFSDLHLATGGVINWANGEVTITETDANTLTVAGVTTFDLGAADLKMGDVLTMDEHASAPSTPASGKVVIYPKTDGLIYAKDDAGTETKLSNVAASAGYTFIETLNGASGTPATLSSTNLSSYDELYIVVQGVSHNSGGAAALRIATSINNGSSYQTALQLHGSTGSAASTYYGNVQIVGMKRGSAMIRSNVFASTSSDQGAPSTSGEYQGWSRNGTSPIDAIQFTFSAGSFDAGTIDVYGR